MDALRLEDEPDQAGAELPLLPEWRERAACRDEPADLFFDESTVAEAKAVCDGCAVAAECLADALELPWLLGVFGRADGCRAPPRPRRQGAARPQASPRTGNAGAQGSPQAVRHAGRLRSASSPRRGRLRRLQGGAAPQVGGVTSSAA